MKLLRVLNSNNFTGICLFKQNRMPMLITVGFIAPTAMISLSCL